MAYYNDYTSSDYQKPVGDYPGKLLGIVAMIFSLLNLIAIPTALVGAILGHIAIVQSKRAGVVNSQAMVAVVLGWVLTLISFAVLALFVVAIFRFS